MNMCHGLKSGCLVVDVGIVEGEKIHEVGKCFVPDLVCIR